VGACEDQCRQKPIHLNPLPCHSNTLCQTFLQRRDKSEFHGALPGHIIEEWIKKSLQKTL
jgi:hypothetical protein